MLLCATTVVLLASTASEGPRFGAAEISLGAGTSQEAYDSAPPVPFVYGSALLEVQLSPAIALELTYDVSKREGRGPSHATGVTSYVSAGRFLELTMSLFASPPGRSTEGNFCLPFRRGQRCVDAVERMGFLSPGLVAEFNTNPERDVVGSLAASVEATFYRIEYDLTSEEAEERLLPVPVQEYRLGFEAAVGFLDRIELGARGSYGIVSGAAERGAERADQLPPMTLPLAPTRFEVGPTLRVRVSPALRAQFSAEYAPYMYQCFGHSVRGALRLSVLPGPLSVFGEVNHGRDISPMDEPTLAFCEQDEPYPDYVNTAASAGIRVEF